VCPFRRRSQAEASVVASSPAAAASAVCFPILELGHQQGEDLTVAAALERTMAATLAQRTGNSSPSTSMSTV